VQFGESLLSKIYVITCDGVEQLLIEDRDMLRCTVVASDTHVIGVCSPMQFLTLAGSAEIIGERTDLKKSQQGEELSDTILDWSAG
jgi:hypothetical protein